MSSIVSFSCDGLFVDFRERDTHAVADIRRHNGLCKREAGLSRTPLMSLPIPSVPSRPELNRNARWKRGPQRNRFRISETESLRVTHPFYLRYIPTARRTTCPKKTKPERATVTLRLRRTTPTQTSLKSFHRFTSESRRWEYVNKRAANPYWNQQEESLLAVDRGVMWCYSRQRDTLHRELLYAHTHTQYLT